MMASSLFPRILRHPSGLRCCRSLLQAVHEFGMFRRGETLLEHSPLPKYNRPAPFREGACKLPRQTKKPVRVKRVAGGSVSMIDYSGRRLRPR
jgi:hypothetical protein